MTIVKGIQSFLGRARQVGTASWSHVCIVVVVQDPLTTTPHQLTPPLCHVM